MTQVRPSPAKIAARKREIAKRYRDQARRKWGPVSFAAVRAAELTRLFEYRYSGLPLPDSDDGVQMVKCMVHHLGRLRDAPRRIGNWCARYAPWLGLESHERLIRDTQERPLRWKADRLAWKLRVTEAERTILKLRTIGAIDMTAEQRAEQRKRRNAERMRALRKAQNATPRAIYEAKSLTQTKPWKAAGISRRTWYRSRGTGPSTA